MRRVEYRHLPRGVPAPWFRQRCTSNDDDSFDAVGGRYILLCFFGSMSQPQAWARSRTRRPGRWKSCLSGAHHCVHQVGVGRPAMRSCARKYLRARATSWGCVGWSTVSLPTMRRAVSRRCLAQ